MTGFGGQTITIMSRSQTGVDELGAAIISTVCTDVTGCLHMPVAPITSGSGGEARSEKTTEIGVGVSTSWWKSTLPVNRANRAAVLSITPDDAIKVDGQVYEIISWPHPFTDGVGRPYKVTIVSEIQASGI